MGDQIITLDLTAIVSDNEDAATAGSIHMLEQMRSRLSDKTLWTAAFSGAAIGLFTLGLGWLFGSTAHTAAIVAGATSALVAQMVERKRHQPGA